MDTGYISYIALIISVVSIAWTVYYNHSERRADVIINTCDLYYKYISRDMLLLRDKGWYFLDELNNSDNDFSYETLCYNSNRDIRNQFDDLYHLIQFWGLINALDRRSLINRKLCYELFHYQFRAWKDQIKQLVDNTDKYSPAHNFELEPFRNNNLAWLYAEKSTIIVKP